MTAKKARIRDVATRAGVSTATVSRVLNNDERVREEYRRRVLKAIEELDYRPNRLARNLRRQRLDMIGVVISDIENPHFSEMVRAVEDEAYGRGRRVLLCNTDERVDKQRGYLQFLADERVAGVILSPSEPGGREIEHLIDLGIPLVAFDRHVQDERADAVVADNVAAARLGTRHLIGLGHRDIGYVGGPPGNEAAAKRLEGYERAMRQAGLRPRAVDGEFRIEGAQVATDALLGGRRRPTALLVANNLMTIGALRALRDRRLAVPGDVALIGVDDPAWAELLEPPLTTLAQPVRRMAQTAVSLLLERIAGERDTAEHVVFPFELRIRRSCGSALAGSVVSELAAMSASRANGDSVTPAPRRGPSVRP